MKFLTAILALFKSNDPERADKAYQDGNESFRRAMQSKIELIRQEGMRESLEHFDQAIDLGLKHPGAFSRRATCLSNLGFELDAIDDFGRAIALDPDDSHNYYGRHVSRNAIGDLLGAIADLKEAIRVASLDHPYNRLMQEQARKMGSSLEERYQIELGGLINTLESQVKIERRNSSLPKEHQMPDYVSQKRTEARRRPRAD